MNNLCAGYDRVIIEPIEPKNQTEGGLYIPDTAKEKPCMGKVINCVCSPDNQEKIIEIGCTAIYGKYAGTEFEYKGKKLVSVKIDDIIACYHQELNESEIND